MWIKTDLAASKNKCALSGGEDLNLARPINKKGMDGLSRLFFFLDKVYISLLFS
jgi:hypothetical protein